MAQETPLLNQPAPDTQIPNPAPDPAKKNAMLFAIIFGIVTVFVIAFFLVTSIISRDSAENSFEPSDGIDPEIEKFLPPASSSSPETIEPKQSPNQTPNEGTQTIAPRPPASNSKTPVAPVILPSQPFVDPALAKLQQQYLGQLEKLIYGKQNTGEDLSKLEPLVSISPYAGKITIRSVARSSTGKTLDEYVVLSTSKDLPENFHITGLTLRSVVSGLEIKIGEGIYLPLNNQINYKESIGVGPGTTIYVITGQSPVGYSFRINKCSGYWSQFQTFKPNLRQTCPKIIYEQPAELPLQMSDDCFNYVNKMGVCKIHVDKSNTSDAIASDPYYQLPPDCRRFIDKTSGYNNCVNINKNVEDFYSNEWRVYLNRNTTLWKTKREIIQLLDDNRKVIAQYAY